MHEEDQDSSSTNLPSVGNPSPGQLSPHQPPPTAVYHPPPPGAPMYPHPGHLPPQLPPPTTVLIPPAQSTNYNTDRITNQHNYNYYGPVHNSGQAQVVPQNRGMAQEDPGSAGDSAFAPQMESMTNLIETYKNMIQNKTLTLMSPGFDGYTSNELEDIVSFLDIQNITPAVVNIKNNCGTTAVINQYVASHPGIALNISQGCWFRLTSQEDITGFLELSSSRHIDIQRVGGIGCDTMCDVAAIPSLTSLMAKVDRIWVRGEQKDDFWSLMHHQTDENNSQFGQLVLGYFKTTDTNIKHIFPLLKRASTVWFLKLVIENSHLSHLSSAFQNQQLNNIFELMVRGMEIGSENVESWAGCLGAVGHVAVLNVKASEDVWCKMGDCLVAMANNGRLKLKTLTFFGKKSQIIEENFKKGGVRIVWGGTKSFW